MEPEVRAFVKMSKGRNFQRQVAQATERPVLCQRQFQELMTCMRKHEFDTSRCYAENFALQECKRLEGAQKLAQGKSRSSVTHQLLEWHKEQGPH